MTESRQDTIERLMREGLNHYGMGHVDEALRCWREVLRLEPEHADAHDFVATAEEATHAGGPPTAYAGGPPTAHVEPATASQPAAAPAPAPSFDDRSEDPLEGLVTEGQRLVREDDLEGGLDLFEAVARRDPMRLDVHGHIESVRSRLVKQYRERMGELKDVPKLRMALDQVMKFNLPAHAGFLLSLVDGDTSIGDIVSLSGMDVFEALRVMHGLLEAGIVAVEPMGTRERRHGGLE